MHSNSRSTTIAMSLPQYTINERALCYHGPLIYEAKILKEEVWDETTSLTGLPGPHFFVHYKGWKQTCVFALSSRSPILIAIFLRWDEWVPISRLLKLDEANLALQKGLAAQSAASNAAASSSRNKAHAVSATKDAGSSRTSRKDGRGTKRGREDVRIPFRCSTTTSRTKIQFLSLITGRGQ
jgi:mortality factor 4-like protein 1